MQGGSGQPTLGGNGGVSILMAWLFQTILIFFGIATLVLLVKWLQRCPRCKSLMGPKGLSGSLLPDYRVKVKRICRKCGQSWEEEGRYDYDMP